MKHLLHPWKEISIIHLISSRDFDVLHQNDTIRHYCDFFFFMEMTSPKVKNLSMPEKRSMVMVKVPQNIWKTIESNVQGAKKH